MGDRTEHRNDGRLTQLWLKCDEATPEAAWEVLERHAEVRRYDDTLTQGKRWRMGAIA